MVVFINVQSVDPVIYAVFNEDWKNQTIVMGFRCHSDRAEPGAGSTWSPRNTARNLIPACRAN